MENECVEPKKAKMEAKPYHIENPPGINSRGSSSPTNGNADAIYLSGPSNNGAGIGGAVTIGRVTKNRCFSASCRTVAGGAGRPENYEKKTI